MVIAEENSAGGIKDLAFTDDIPTALPNPNVLTINNTTYDGSEATDMTSTIQAMIDASIAAIPSAEEASF